MNDFVRRNPMIAVLATAVILLAAAIALEFVYSRPGGDRTQPRRASAAEAKLLPPIVAVAPEQAYPETSARPLFTPTRRLAPEAAVAQQPAFTPGQYALLGVTIAGDTRIAMLREKSSGRVVRIARGSEVNGIKVAAIEPESVTLAMGGQQEQVPLLVQRPGAGGPGQPAPPAAPSALQGPFAPAGAGGTPGAAPTPQVPMAAPPPFTGGAPAGAPGPHPAVPGAPAQPAAPFTPNATPQPAADPNAGLTPEEILARRRARRAQQTQ
jgi:hypothetical protein